MGLALNAALQPVRAPNARWASLPLPTRAADPSLWPEVQLRSADDGQLALALASEGVLRYVWHGRYGDMLIEARGEDVFVNGQRVERHRG